MQIGNGCNETETETVTGAVPAAFKAIKTSQNVLAFIERNPWSAVGDA